MTAMEIITIVEKIASWRCGLDMEIMKYTTQVTGRCQLMVRMVTVHYVLCVAPAPILRFMVHPCAQSAFLARSCTTLAEWTVAIFDNIVRA